MKNVSQKRGNILVNTRREVDMERIYRYFSLNDIDISEISPPIRPVYAELLKRFK